MGGTFMSMPGDYRDYFIRNLHDALSGHSSSSVREAVRYSEQASMSCACFAPSTRTPDTCTRRQCWDMLCGAEASDRPRQPMVQFDSRCRAVADQVHRADH